MRIYALTLTQTDQRIHARTPINLAVELPIYTIKNLLVNIQNQHFISHTQNGQLPTQLH